MLSTANAEVPPSYQISTLYASGYSLSLYMEEHSYYFVIGLNPHCGLIMSLLLFLLLD
jgi:hypothetical protein